MPIGNPGRDFDNILANVKEFETLDQCELILVIDAPACSEADELTSIYSKNHKVTVLQISCGNPGGARNLGKKHSVGEWITFIDSDDLIEFKNFYQLVVEGSLAGAELTLGKYRSINEGGFIHDSKEYDSEYGIAKSIARNPGIWRMSFKRNLVEEIDFPNLRMAEDQVFLARLRFWERNIWASDFLVYTYRRNILGQLTRNMDAISDILQAQAITLDLYVNERPKSVGSRILATVVVNQLLTSFRHLGLRGLVPLRQIYRTEIGLVQALGISARLSSVMLEEILHKARKVRKVSRGT